MKSKPLYFIIHKPYKVLSQFSNENGNPGLGSLYDLPKDVYPVGRLDLDSEGLLILTNDKSLNHQLLHPQNAHERVYWVEVDGVPDQKDLDDLQQGVTIRINGKVHQTRKAEARVIAPEIADRVPSVNTIKHPVRSWVELKLKEGKNRQVRRMTAAVAHPTLRLIRVSIEDLKLGSLASGAITQVSQKVIYKKLKL
ncbi:MAG: pseudouridine synthase [Bacteroidota bacterium]